MSALVQFAILMAWAVVAVVVVTSVFWLFDLPVSRGVFFSEWWANRPTSTDPCRWERFEKERLGKGKKGGST